MKDYKTLKVWEKSHALTLQIYEITKLFPDNELYGLISQIRRASTSIGLNIAEGCGADTDPDFKKFLQISLKSACEVSYNVLLSKDLGFIDEKTYLNLNSQIEEIQKMLSSLIVTIKKSINEKKLKK